MNLLKEWYHRYFADPQVVILALMLIGGFVFVIVSKNILAPLFIAVVFAYLLEGLVQRLCRGGVPRLPAVSMVFLVFMVFVVTLVFLLFPKLSRQVTLFFQELPSMMNQGEALLRQLPDKYPAVFSESQVVEWIQSIKDEITQYGQQILSRTVSSVVSIITVTVYVILVPILIFFMMKDKERIIRWFHNYLPRDRALVREVWRDVDAQIGNYIRGKFWEILIIWGMSYLTFIAFGLEYAMLLGFLVGLSVIIPYVGAVLVTIPIAVIAYFQWGLGSEWVYLMLAYFVIQAIDANVLVPLLFSEVVNLHPISIIVAVLFFGGIWGVWGVFFSIPLATLVQAVLKAWPSSDDLPTLQEPANPP